MNPCPTERQLEDLAGGALTNESKACLESHLNECEQCRDICQQYRANLKFLSQVEGPLEKMGQSDSALEMSGDAIELGALDSFLLSDLGPGAVAEPACATTPSVETVPGYEIVGEIHRGGQGVVYEAIQKSTRRTVAIKVLLEGYHASERAKWRFEREVKLIAALRHPNIVLIHDSGIAQGRYYFVMDHIQGMCLDAYVRRARPDIRRTIELFAQVCDAVAHAHHRGVIHRDLKPSNVLAREDGTPCVLDFGLAKVTAEELGDSRPGFVSLTGQVMGTVQYMAPEQTMGNPDAIDTRTDVYALGLILYELLTFRPAYVIDHRDLSKAFEMIRMVDPARPSKYRKDVNSEIDAIVLKALEKKPERRYQSAGEFEQDLRAWLDGSPVSARSASSFYVLRKLAARHYFHTSVITALLAAIIGFGGITFHALLGEREASQTLVLTNQQFAGLNTDLTNRLDQSQAEMDKAMIGWFLREWHGGRSEAAEYVRQKLMPGAPAREAIEFLIDDQRSVNELANKLPDDPASRAMMLFLVGERHLKNGRTTQAREAYSECVAMYRGFWLPFAQARLDQLTNQSSQRPTQERNGAEH